MSRFAPKTLRRMPPATREIARLANELASVQTRLANRVERLTEHGDDGGRLPEGVLQQRRPRKRRERRAQLRQSVGRPRGTPASEGTR